MTDPWVPPFSPPHFAQYYNVRLQEQSRSGKSRQTFDWAACSNVRAGEHAGFGEEERKWATPISSI